MGSGVGKKSSLSKSRLPFIEKKNVDGNKDKPNKQKERKGSLGSYSNSTHSLI